MKKILLPLLFILLSHFCIAQQWYFGYGAGISFPGLTAIAGGQTATGEGCAVANDANGNMLFYTDGTSVWDRTHARMLDGNGYQVTGTPPVTISPPGGYGLAGSPSATQSAIIVPKPKRIGCDTCQCDTFYIFTVSSGDGPTSGGGNTGGAFLAANFTRGFCWSMVVFDSQHPDGYVVSKNNQLRRDVAEKLTSIDAGNNTYWVLVHGYDARITNLPTTSNDKTFYCYQVSSAGVSSIPVTSTVGSPQISTSADSYDNAPGQMKFSPDGKMVALAVHTDRYAELYDFSITSGQLSNCTRLNLPQNNQGTAYGIEFSPDSRQLFIGQNWPYIFRVNLNNITNLQYTPPPISLPLVTHWYQINSNSLPGSIIDIINPGSLGVNTYDFGSFQAGPNGSIYIARTPLLGSFYRLSEIQNPNLFTATFLDNSVNLGSFQCKMSLPTVITGKFGKVCDTTAIDSTIISCSTCKQVLSSVSLTTGSITPGVNYNLQSIQLNFTTLSSLQEVQISIADLSYTWDKDGCKNCKTEAIGRGCLFPVSPTQTIGGLVWDNIYNSNVPPSANPLACPGELIWNLGAALPPGTYSVPMNISLPVSTVPVCCNLHIDKMCLKLSYKDMDCNTCDTIICPDTSCCIGGRWNPRIPIPIGTSAITSNNCGNIQTPLMLTCAQPYALLANYICRDKSCSSKVTYGITGAVTASGTLPATFIPSATGISVITFYAWCGNKICDSCKVWVMDTCSYSPGCTCSFNNVTISDGSQQNFQINCGAKPINWSVNSTATLNPNFYCVDLNGVVCPKVGSLTVYVQNVTAQTPAVTLTTPNYAYTFLQPGTYQYTLLGSCGSNVCDCTFTLIVQ